MSKKAISHLYTISHGILGLIFFYLGCSAFGFIESALPKLGTTVVLLTCFAIINGVYIKTLEKEEGYNNTLNKENYVSGNILGLVFFVCLAIVVNLPFDKEDPHVYALGLMFLVAPGFYAAWLGMHIATIEDILGLRKDKGKTQKTTSFTHC